MTGKDGKDVPASVITSWARLGILSPTGYVRALIRQGFLDIPMDREIDIKGIIEEFSLEKIDEGDKAVKLSADIIARAIVKEILPERGVSLV